MYNRWVSNYDLFSPDIKLTPFIIFEQSKRGTTFYCCRGPLLDNVALIYYIRNLIT